MSETAELTIDAPVEQSSTGDMMPSIDAPGVDAASEQSQDAELRAIARQHIPAEYGGNKQDAPKKAEEPKPAEEEQSIAEPQEDEPTETGGYEIPEDGRHAFSRLQIPQEVAQKLVGDIAAAQGNEAAQKFVDAISARATYTDKLSRENSQLREQVQQLQAPQKPAQPALPTGSKRFKVMAEMFGEEAAKEMIAEEQAQLEALLQPIRQQSDAVRAQREAELIQREQADTAAGLEAAAKEVSPSTLADPAKKQEILDLAADMFRSRLDRLRREGKQVSLDTLNLKSLIPQAARALYPADIARRERARLASEASRVVRQQPDNSARPASSRPAQSQDDVERELARAALAKHGIKPAG